MTVELSEKDLQAAIIQLAHIYGWRVAHFRPAMNAKGQWRTPVAADGAGFPDLCMVSNTTVAYVEVKARKGRLNVNQTVWLDRLKMAGAEAMVWRPAEWQDGTIERFLIQRR